MIILHVNWWSSSVHKTYEPRFLNWGLERGLMLALTRLVLIMACYCCYSIASAVCTEYGGLSSVFGVSEGIMGKMDIELISISTRTQILGFYRNTYIILANLLTIGNSCIGAKSYSIVYRPWAHDVRETHNVKFG